MIRGNDFDTPGLLSKVLTSKRWKILKAICGQGPISIGEIARRVDRDVKAIHGDVEAQPLPAYWTRLKMEGLSFYIRTVFLYEAVHVDFPLRAA